MRQRPVQVRAHEVDPLWREDASCKGMDSAIFYPGLATDPSRWTSSATLSATQAETMREAPAKAVCAACGVAEACLSFAMASGERDGIWGGLNGKERERLRRERRLG